MKTFVLYKISDKSYLGTYKAHSGSEAIKGWCKERGFTVLAGKQMFALVDAPSEDSQEMACQAEATRRGLDY